MPYRKKSLMGQTFNRWTVIGEAPSSSRRFAMWLCRCECGTERAVRATELRKGGSKSCGCYSIELTKERGTSHGKSYTPEYTSWKCMIQRCTNPNDSEFFRYGMRGITVCERWLNSFENFYEDMGDRPTLKHSIDRYPNKKGNYEPSNCRWATKRQQAGNTESNRWLEGDGKKMILEDWARYFGIAQAQLWNYLDRGHSMEEAIEFYSNKVTK